MSRSGQDTRDGTQAQPGLQDMDYFKVYISTPYASHVRDLLHSWRYECTLPTQQGSEVVRLRLLRGAKLALVDEVNEGVLIW